MSWGRNALGRCLSLLRTCSSPLTWRYNRLTHMSITHHFFSTEIGLCLLGISPSAVRFLQFGESPSLLLQELYCQFPGEVFVEASTSTNRSISHLERAVHAAIHGRDGELASISIAPVGSEFQLRVWDHLRAIPSGETRSYSEIAVALNIPSASRAVAKACGANSIALFIPCHRVIRRDGSLGGFRWGLETKRLLLAVERSVRLDTLRSTTRASM